jgi:hypothetical protein
MDNYNIIVNDAPSYNIVFNQPEEQYTIVLENGQGANGAKGDTGNTGPQGIQGIPGPPGVIQLSNTTTSTLTGYIIGNGSTITADPRIDGGNF